MVTFTINLPEDMDLRMNIIASVLKESSCKLISIDNVTRKAVFESTVEPKEEAIDSKKPTILLD